MEKIVWSRVARGRLSLGVQLDRVSGILRGCGRCGREGDRVFS